MFTVFFLGLLLTEHLVAACVCHTSRRDEEISICAVRDLLLPVVEPSSVRPHEVTDPVSVILDDLMEAAHMPKDDLLALQSTSERERSRADVKAVDMMAQCLDKPSSIPLLLFDLKSLLVRLSCFVVDNQHLSAEDKKKLCHLLACRFLAAVCVKTVLRLVLRSSRSTVNRFASGKLRKEEQCG
ncbi:hypothetical protein OESDEN_16844, partial [Oesophagostomum dentatum]